MSLKILEVLHANGAISESIFALVHRYAVAWQCSGYTALLDTNIFDEFTLADILASILKIDRIYNIDSIQVDDEALSLISYQMALKYECLPLSLLGAQGQSLEVLVADCTDSQVLAELQSVLNCELSLAVGERSDIVKAINRLYPIEKQLPSLESLRHLGAGHDSGSVEGQ